MMLWSFAAPVFVAGASTANAFSVSQSRTQKQLYHTSIVLSMSETETETPSAVEDVVERGVSVDQDGKSNVWAIEPKMEVDSRSSEEKTSSSLLAAGGFAAFAAAAAGILTNLPDPDQF